MEQFDKSEVEKTLATPGLWGASLSIFIGFSFFMCKAFSELEMYKAICVSLFVTLALYFFGGIYKYFLQNKASLILFVLICAIPSIPILLGYSLDKNREIFISDFWIAFVPWQVFYMYKISSLKRYLNSTA